MSWQVGPFTPAPMFACEVMSPWIAKDFWSTFESVEAVVQAATAVLYIQGEVYGSHRHECERQNGLLVLIGTDGEYSIRLRLSPECESGDIAVHPKCYSHLNGTLVNLSGYRYVYCKQMKKFVLHAEKGLHLIMQCRLPRNFSKVVDINESALVTGLREICNEFYD